MFAAIFKYFENQCVQINVIITQVLFKNFGVSICDYFVCFSLS